MKGMSTMTFRKIASLALAMLMLCSVLCACTEPNAGSTPSNPASSTNPTSGSNGDPQTITYQVAVYDV